MDTEIILPDTQYGTDVRTPHATVRPMLIEGKAGIGIQGLRQTMIVTQMSPEDARRLGLDMIEVANRADAAKLAGPANAAAEEFSYSPLGPDRLWIFLIDTDSYAGNFEREMCAYMTGRIGDCGAGGEMAERYCRDMGIPPGSEPNPHVVSMPDDHGCSRPASCWVTPGAGACNTVAIFMDTEPTESEVESMIERAKRYAVEVVAEREDARRREYEERGWDFVAEEKIEVLGFRLLLRETIESQVATFPTS